MSCNPGYNYTGDDPSWYFCGVYEAEADATVKIVFDGYHEVNPIATYKDYTYVV